jgi:hypothetical protein
MQLPIKSLLATTASVSLVLAQPISNDAINLDPRGLSKGLSKLLPLGQNKGLETCTNSCQSEFQQCLNKKEDPSVDCELPLKICAAGCVSKYPKGKLGNPGY